MISLNNVNWNHLEMKKFNYMLDIDILRKSSQNILGVLKGVFKGLGRAALTKGDQLMSSPPV